MAETINEKIKNAAEEKKDSYLESQYATLELCELAIQNKAVLSDEHVAKAEKLKEETIKNIKLRESILQK